MCGGYFTEDQYESESHNQVSQNVTEFVWCTVTGKKTEQIRPGGPDLAAITGPMLPKTGLIQFWPFCCAKSGPSVTGNLAPQEIRYPHSKYPRIFCTP